MGVATIIDLRARTNSALQEKAWAERLGMQYINLPMDDHAPTPLQVATFLQAVEVAAKAEPGERPAVFVHCQHGSDRTGCMVGIWRVTHDGFSYKKAYSEMRRYYFTPAFTMLSGAVKEYAYQAAAEKAQKKFKD
jgi:protein-tyrosine phosphatase